MEGTLRGSGRSGGVATVGAYGCGVWRWSGERCNVFLFSEVIVAELVHNGALDGGRQPCQKGAEPTFRECGNHEHARVPEAPVIKSEGGLENGDGDALGEDVADESKVEEDGSTNSNDRGMRASKINVRQGTHKTLYTQ
jgi:hypothetical protein